MTGESIRQMRRWEDKVVAERKSLPREAKEGGPLQKGQSSVSEDISLWNWSEDMDSSATTYHRDMQYLPRSWPNTWISTMRSGYV
ncbi:hypothetical protein Y1Q_0016421 [Alligator mississippiensis]|uniref:Uncharacterized protein n=1 Tax=Alligator mississippiensis TaxID=8496 RepID=A0A151N2R6_ALLMI|nr:hypothetical protein Y1Q_0016421 [Alligator mississippiensis]